MPFSQAVRLAQERWLTAIADAAWDELVQSLGRATVIEQAQGVEDVVRRFSHAEIDGSTRIGRFGPVKFIPTLSDVAGPRLLGYASQDSARAAIESALANGYALMATLEDPPGAAPPRTRTAREIWDVWAPGLTSGLIERTGVEGDLLKWILAVGAESFKDDALGLGLGRFGRKARLTHIGAFYTRSGLLLRAVHTHDGPLVPDPLNVWQFDDLPA